MRALPNAPISALGLEYAADFRAGANSVHFHHARVDALLITREPKPGCRPDARRHHPKQRSSRELVLADPVPTLIELSFEFCGPIFGRMMLRMRWVASIGHAQPATAARPHGTHWSNIATNAQSTALAASSTMRTKIIYRPKSRRRQ
jgi:hypothetical protein